MKTESQPNSIAFYVRLSVLLLLLIGAIWARYTKYPPVVRAVNMVFGGGTGVSELAPLTDEQLQNESNAAKSLDGIGIKLQSSKRTGAIVSVDFDGVPMADEMAQYLANLLRLQYANLANSEMNNVQAEVIGPLAELRVLDLSNCPLSDGAFAKWSQFPYMNNLNVSGTGVTSDGIVRVLELCPRLETLDISRCKKLDDRAVEAILNAKTLKSVSCADGGLSMDQQQRINIEMSNRK